MRLVALRTFNHITSYGYAHDGTPAVHWSMRFYPETWRIPMALLG